MKKLVLLLAVVASATLFSCTGTKAVEETTANEEQTEAPAETGAVEVEAPADSSAAQA